MHRNKSFSPVDGDPEDLLRFGEIIKDLLNTNEPVEEIRTESQGQESENGRKLKTSRWRAILVRMVDIWKVEGKVRQGEQEAVHEKVSMVDDSKTDCLMLSYLFS